MKKKMFQRSVKHAANRILQITLPVVQYVIKSNLYTDVIGRRSVVKESSVSKEKCCCFIAEALVVTQFEPIEKSLLNFSYSRPSLNTASTILSLGHGILI